MEKEMLFWSLLAAVGTTGEENEVEVSISLSAITEVRDEVVGVVNFEAGVAEFAGAPILLEGGSVLEVSTGAGDGGGGTTLVVDMGMLDVVDMGGGVVVVDTAAGVVDVEKVD